MKPGFYPSLVVASPTPFIPVMSPQEAATCDPKLPSCGRKVSTSQLHMTSAQLPVVVRRTMNPWNHLFSFSHQAFQPIKEQR